MRNPFRKKSRYEKARDQLRRMVSRARERLQVDDETESEDERELDHPRQRPRRCYRARPVLRIIIR